jgi:hypothetical protein
LERKYEKTGCGRKSIDCRHSSLLPASYSSFEEEEKKRQRLG